MESKYQRRRKIEREDAKKSPAEYRDWEAIVQTISMNGTVGEKRTQGESLKERSEDGC